MTIEIGEHLANLLGLYGLFATILALGWLGYRAMRAGWPCGRSWHRWRLRVRLRIGRSDDL